MRRNVVFHSNNSYLYLKIIIIINLLLKKKKTGHFEWRLRQPTSGLGTLTRGAKGATYQPISARHTGTCQFRGKKDLARKPMSRFRSAGTKKHNNNRSDCGRVARGDSLAAPFFCFNGFLRQMSKNLDVIRSSWPYFLDGVIKKDKSAGYFGLKWQMRTETGLGLCSASGSGYIFIFT